MQREDFPDPPASPVIPTLLQSFRRVGEGYLRVTHQPAYFPLWLGQLISNFGDTLNYIALVVLVFRLTGQGLAVSGLVVFEVIPVLLLGPVAGVVIDRVDRKTILITADLVRAFLILGLVVANAVWEVYAIAILVAAATVFFSPTVTAVIPALLSEEDLLAANSVSWTSGRLVQIIGAAIAGGLIGVVGTSLAFLVNAVSFAVSAALISRFAIPPHAGLVAAPPTQPFQRYLQDAREGFDYARQTPFVRHLLVLQMIASFAVGATSALLVVLAERHYHLPPAGFAWFIGAIGVGALLGPFIVGVLAPNPRDPRLLVVPYVIRGVGDALLALVTAVPLGLLLLFIYGLNTSSGMVIYNTQVQRRIPERIRGRIYTALDVGWNAMRILSLTLGGLLVDRIGIAALYYLGGALLAGAGLLGLWLFRHESPEIAR